VAEKSLDKRGQHHTGFGAKWSIATWGQPMTIRAFLRQDSILTLATCLLKNAQHPDEQFSIFLSLEK